jgi:hypothetical protein
MGGDEALHAINGGSKMASKDNSVVMGGPSSVDSGAGKDRISGGDTVNASHRSGAGGEDALFSFGLGAGAATLTGSGSLSGLADAVEAAPRARMQHGGAVTITLEDDTVISFVDAKAMLATIALPQMTLN